MKLSLSWIFDHIEGSWRDHDVEHIVAKFNQTTAEIEHVYPINFELNNFALSKVIFVNLILYHLPIILQAI